MGAHWSGKVYMFVKFHIHTYYCVWDNERNMEKTFQLAVGVCCCLQTCNSVINMLVMGLVLGPSLMVISITGVLLYFAKVSPLYSVLWGLLLFTCKANRLQTFEHMCAHWAIKVEVFARFHTEATARQVIGPYLCAKFQTCIYLLWFLIYWDSNWRTRTTTTNGKRLIQSSTVLCDTVISGIVVSSRGCLYIQYSWGEGVDPSAIQELIGSL